MECAIHDESVPADYKHAIHDESVRDDKLLRPNLEITPQFYNEQSLSMIGNFHESAIRGAAIY